MPFLTSYDNTRIYYEVYGEGDINLVFLNGVMADTNSWVYQKNFFVKKRFKAILHDFRGQGKSDKPKISYSMDMHVEDLRCLLELLEIKKAVLIGLSYGGKVALLYTLKYPDTVDKLILLDTVHVVDKPLRARVDRWLYATRLRSGRVLFQIVYPDIYSDRFIEENWDFIMKTAPNFEYLDFDSLEGLLIAFMKIDLRGSISSIETPTLIIVGKEDKVFPPRYSRLIHSEIKQSKYIEVEDAGHVMIWEKPDEVNKLIYGFILSE